MFSGINIFFIYSIFDSYGLDTIMSYKTKLDSWFRIYLDQIANYKDIFIFNSDLFIMFIHFIQGYHTSEWIFPDLEQSFTDLKHSLFIYNIC